MTQRFPAIDELSGQSVFSLLHGRGRCLNKSSEIHVKKMICVNQKDHDHDHDHQKFNSSWLEVDR